MNTKLIATIGLLALIAVVGACSPPPPGDRTTQSSDEQLQQQTSPAEATNPDEKDPQKSN